MLIKFFKKIKFLEEKQDLDARFWIQKLLLKKSLSSLKY
jgi:hypothetical protein|tara:strand:- start:79 stop:195 length:117 start_codon:yes stop_codon:yes gene_type:complete